MGNISVIAEEVDYRSSPRINQSFLKDVINNVTKRDDTTPAMEDGNVVDCLITTPGLFGEKYVVVDIQLPPDSIKKTLDSVYTVAISPDLEFHQSQITTSYRSFSDNNWGDAAIMKNVKEKGQLYWESLWQAQGKKILSTSEYDNYTRVVYNLLTGKTAKYFEADGLVEELFYQVPLYFDYCLDDEIFECKALLDILRINHVERTVQMLDVKTTGSSTKYWPYLAKKLGYHIQGAFYNEALKFCYPDYQVLNPVFLVESITYPGKPRDFICTDLDLKLGKSGGQYTRGFLVSERDCFDCPLVSEEVREQILGFEDALRILKQSRDLGLHDYDVDYKHHCRNEIPYQLNVFL